MSVPTGILFPVAAAKKQVIKDSFCRRYIPGTTRLYDRARSCCCRDPHCSCPGHCGTDLAGGLYGAQVRAPTGGIIRVKSFGKAFGLHQISLVIRDGGHAGGAWFFAHMKDSRAHDGEYVPRGTIIGHVGNSGQTTGGSGTHLHFEWRDHWKDWCSSRDAYYQLELARRRMLAA